MDFSKPQKIVTKVFETTMLNARVLKVSLTLEEPTEIIFKPGQFISINVGNNTYRPYSLCSDPYNTKQLQIVAAVDHEGLGSNFLKQLKVGERVELIGPAGRFSLPDTLLSDITFICTGTGIAPFIPMLYYLQRLNYQGHIKMYFGLRDEAELFMIEELLSFEKKLNNFEFLVCFSQQMPAIKTPFKSLSGRITAHLALSKPKNTLFLICGNPYMVEDTEKILKTNYVPLENIILEHFKTAAPSPK